MYVCPSANLAKNTAITNTYNMQCTSMNYYFHIIFISGYLYHLTTYLTKSLQEVSVSENAGKHDFLKKLTKPFTTLVIQLDKKVIEAWATGNKEYANHSLIKVSVCHIYLWIMS